MKRSSNELPFSSSPHPAERDALSQRLRARIQAGRTMSELTLATGARDVWAALYHALSQERPGIAGDLLGRAEAQVRRLARLYAVLDGQAVIESVHLKAACALWSYAEASTRYIFGDNTGDPHADTILRAVQAQGSLDDTTFPLCSPTTCQRLGSRKPRPC